MAGSADYNRRWPGCQCRAQVLTTIFNLSLAQSVVPTCFKRFIVVPAPKITSSACLNDYRPVALTSVARKCSERLVKNDICSSLPSTLDSLKFAYCSNRTMNDVISQVLHITLSHLDNRGGDYVRLLLIDFSSAFDTIVPSRLASKLTDVSLTTLCAHGSLILLPLDLRWSECGHIANPFHCGPPSVVLLIHIRLHG